MKSLRYLLGLALIIALSGNALIGCGDDDDDSTEDGGTAGKSGKGGSGGKAGSSSAGKGGSSSAGKGGSSSAGKGGSSSAGKGGAGGAAGKGDDDAGMSCEGEKGCYSCEPKSNEQYLNACTDAVCNAYDNSKLKKLGSDGKLPAIP